MVDRIRIRFRNHIRSMVGTCASVKHSSQVKSGDQNHSRQGHCREGCHGCHLLPFPLLRVGVRVRDALMLKGGGDVGLDNMGMVYRKHDKSICKKQLPFSFEPCRFSLSQKIEGGKRAANTRPLNTINHQREGVGTL